MKVDLNNPNHKWFIELLINNITKIIIGGFCICSNILYCGEYRNKHSEHKPT
jgi:hypothetical protein